MGDDALKILATAAISILAGYVVSGLIHGRKLCEVFCPWIKAQGGIEGRLARLEADVRTNEAERKADSAKLRDEMHHGFKNARMASEGLRELLTGRQPPHLPRRSKGADDQ